MMKRYDFGDHREYEPGPVGADLSASIIDVNGELIVVDVAGDMSWRVALGVSNNVGLITVVNIEIHFVNGTASKGSLCDV
jgi:hypothetical protein